MGKINKYNNKKTVVDGISFDSKHEALRYNYLKRLKEHGEISNFGMQPRYVVHESFEKYGKKYRAITYTPDFWIENNEGGRYVEDVKGMSTQQGNMRRKLFDSKYPEIPLSWVSRSLKYGDADGWIDYDELQKKRRDAKKSRL